LTAATEVAAGPEDLTEDKPTPGTIAAFMTIWLRDEIKAKKTAATYRSYEELFRVHIKPAIGHSR
jgi:hypothetical protein